MNITESNIPGDVLLPRPPGMFRRWLAGHPKVVDGFIVGSYLFGCLLMIVISLLSGVGAQESSGADAAPIEDGAIFSDYLTLPWVFVSAGIVAITAFVLAYRRRYPLGGLVLLALLQFFEQGLLILPNSVAFVFLLYAVPVYRSVRAGWIAFGIALVSNTIALQLSGGGGTGVIGPHGILLADTAGSLADKAAMSSAQAVWLLAVLMIGINFGNRRRYVDALIDRAYQLAREREQQAQLAAAAERARIAREMHDIVAHSLSVVVTLSEAAAVSLESQPEAAKQALERSAETGRSALTEMRRLLGVLNDGGIGDAGDAEQRPSDGILAEGVLAPQPDIAAMVELVQGFTDAGLCITVTQQGTPTGDPTQQLAVYRIVQEALTNALRYAGIGAQVAIEVRHISDATHITVTDSGRSTELLTNTTSPPLPGSGRGLDGARQRAQIFGGEVNAGPEGAGWKVIATVPIDAPAQQRGAAMLHQKDG